MTILLWQAQKSRWLEDQPAYISGTTVPQARVLVAKWPWTGIDGQPYLHEAWPDEAGSFRVAALSAGEYRVVATRNAVDAQQLLRLLSLAPKLSLRAGQQQVIAVKFSEPSR